MLNWILIINFYMDMMNSCSAKYLVFKFELSFKFRHNCYNLKLALNLNLWEEYLI